MKHRLLFVFVSVTYLTFAQPSNFNTQRNWAMNKHELTLGIGITEFLGDLGGANQIGTDYSLKDLDFNSTHLGGSFAYRYRFHPYYATSTIINGGMLRGNDALTTEPIRNMRNLNFKSFFISLSQRFEVIVLANEKIGRRFNIPGLRGFTDHNEQLYLFGGIGIMYYNPKGNMNGAWVALHDLHTEGQGLPDGPKQYKRVTAVIPLGVGFRIGINRMWRIGMELTYVKTFSDYIDDVHGVYYDPAALAQAYGPNSAYMSNPSHNPSAFNPGSQRGDKQKDAMLYANITIIRNITYNPGRNSGHIQFGKRYRAKF